MGSNKGGSRTTGFIGSAIRLLFLDITDPAGEAMASRPISLVIEDLRLVAMLGLYILPPNMLFLAEKLPYPEKLPLPLDLPNPCWLGLIALGMNINDLSIAGKMYLGG